MPKGRVSNNNLTGMIFDRLTVIDRHHSSYWNCICSCGYISIIRMNELFNGKRTKCKYCGGSKGKYRLSDLTNTKINKWTILGRAPTKGKQALWRCMCECGNIRIITNTNLTSSICEICTNDISGQKINQWTVISKFENTHKYNVVCECGLKTVRNFNQIHNTIGCKKCNSGGNIITDLTGLVVGKLTVISLIPKINNRTYWLCKCSCGKTHTVRADLLVSGQTKKCSDCNHISFGDPGVYQLIVRNSENTIIGRYIGEASSIRRRFKTHKEHLESKRHHCLLLRRLYNELENIEYDIIDTGEHLKETYKRKEIELNLIKSLEDVLNTRLNEKIVATQLYLPNRKKYQNKILYIQNKYDVIFVYENDVIIGAERIKGKIKAHKYYSDVNCNITKVK